MCKTGAAFPVRPAVNFRVPNATDSDAGLRRDNRIFIVSVEIFLLFPDEHSRIAGGMDKIKDGRRLALALPVLKVALAVVDLAYVGGVQLLHTANDGRQFIVLKGYCCRRLGRRRRTPTVQRLARLNSDKPTKISVAFANALIIKKNYFDRIKYKY